VLGETARDLGVGVLILVDELQESALGELAALNTAVHYLGQAETPLPLTLIGAGLPSLPAQLAEATSYAERLYDYRPVGLLTEQASKDALTVPAEARGVEWAPGGLAAAVETAQGYPYFLQSIGKHVWDNARRSPIDESDVEVGLAEARREVDDGLYRSRWERATPAQRDLLRALAGIGREDPAAVADATLLMLAFQPGRRGPLPRGADRGDIETAFPGWTVLDEEPADVSGMPGPLKSAAPRW